MQDVLRSIEAIIAEIITKDESIRLPKGFDPEWLNE